MKISANLLCCLVILISVAGCRKDDEPDAGEKTRRRTSQVLRFLEESHGLDPLDIKEPYDKLIPPARNIYDVKLYNDDGKLFAYDLTYQQAEKMVVKHSDKFHLKGDNSHIWPGALLQGKYINKGVIAPVDLREFRKPVTVNLNLVNGGVGKTTETVEVPSLANINEAVNGIIKSQFDNGGAFYGNFVFTPEEVQSYEQVLAFADIIDEETKKQLRNYEWKNSDKVYYIAKLEQVYYTIYLDSPAAFYDIFNNKIAKKDLEPYVGPNNPLCYVSEVSWGRVFYILYEFNRNEYLMSKNLMGELEKASKAGSMLTTFQKSKYKSAKVTVFQYGGNVGSVVEDVIKSKNVDDLYEYLNGGMVMTPENIGAPIRYCVNIVPIGLPDHDNLPIENYEEHEFAYTNYSYKSSYKNNNISFRVSAIDGYRCNGIGDYVCTGAKMYLDNLRLSLSGESPIKTVSIPVDNSWASGINIHNRDFSDNLVKNWNTNGGYKEGPLGFQTARTITMRFTVTVRAETKKRKYALGICWGHTNPVWRSKTYVCSVGYRFNTGTQKWEINPNNTVLPAGVSLDGNRGVVFNDNVNNARFRARISYNFIVDNNTMW